MDMVQDIAVAAKAAGNTDGTPGSVTLPIRASFVCVAPSSHGEIVVMERKTSDESRDYVVGWRRDRRHRRTFLRLSSFRDREVALRIALSYSNRFVPGTFPTPSRKRDFQRTCLYCWEKSAFAHNVFFSDADEARQFCLSICQALCVESPALDISSRFTHSFYSASRGIVLSSSMVDRNTVLHELSHHLVRLMSICEPSHGPAFVAVLIALQCKFGGGKLRNLIDDAQASGLEVNDHISYGLFKMFDGAALKLAA